MMEAKDTIIRAKQIDELEKEFAYEELATHRVVDAYLKAQAEISFRAGIKEVVGWVINNSKIHSMDMLPPILEFWFSGNDWQAKLKEWNV